MDLYMHPGVAALVLALLALLLHRALRPCRCCTHHHHRNNDFKDT